MRVAGAVCSVGAGAEGERVEDALDVVLLDRGEEGFVRGGVVGEGGGDGLDVGSVDVFVGDESEPAVAVRVGWGLEVGCEGGFPDHVADAVADEEEEFDDVGGEGGRVEG